MDPTRRLLWLIWDRPIPTKTLPLMKYMSKNNDSFDYVPVDTVESRMDACRRRGSQAARTKVHEIARLV